MRLRAALLVLLTCAASGQTVYQKPPQEVLEILNAPPTPVISVSPAGTHALLAQTLRYPPIAVLSQPMLRLAGLRINPRTHGPHNPVSYVSLTITRLSDGKQTRLTLPPGAQAGTPEWSADGKHIAFTLTTREGIELWIAETGTGALRRIPGVKLNAIYGETIQWMPDHHTLFVRAVPTGRGKPPAPPDVPKGPIIQESEGQAAGVWTYQDLLSSPHDEDLFDYYATAQLALIDAASGKVTPLGKPGIFGVNEPSPDGKYFLVSRIHRPYSYLHPIASFARDVEVWDANGNTVYTLAKLPLAANVPIGGVPTGPRSYSWRPTAPASLVWVEALDGGDSARKAAHRDKILTLSAPFREQPVELFRTEHRFSGVTWVDHSDWVMVRDYHHNRRWSTTTLLDAAHPERGPRVLWSRNIQDRYNDPGQPVLRTLAPGRRIAVFHQGKIYLHGAGATPGGDRPFLRRYDLLTGATEELFRSAADCYEEFVALMDDAGTHILTRHESPTHPPNYFVRSASSARALTHFPDPAPQLRKIRKELVTYKRADGVPLSFTLYLPPDYQPGTRLPTVMWAYPREYNDPDTAGQIVGSAQRFTAITGPSHLFFLLQGYAILDNAAMPVVGTPQEVNDTYIEQIVMNAKAAIDKATEMGVTDPARVGVGGHSYGAFMTANLLAHSDLFRAGIARSGAYNRTLTPFGFQSERRTLWQAPELYLKMSPFMYAHKINEPILLIHGEADNNAGTFPIQSERMYQAIRGNKGKVRFVLLPYESHGYVARESVEHTLWEMFNWFDKYVKQP